MLFKAVSVGLLIVYIGSLCYKRSCERCMCQSDLDIRLRCRARLVNGEVVDARITLVKKKGIPCPDYTSINHDY